MELVKSILKVVLVGGLAFVLIWLLFHDILSLGALDFKQAYLASAEMVGWFFLAVCSTVILLAAFDVPFQIFQHRKKLRMTKQEVKEERKNTEGSPEIKGKIRRLQIEAAMRRMMEEVPKADVVITNPTHFAVALRYDDKRMRAPKVVAKGSDLVAARIREIATENNVPLFSAPPLARAIYFTTEINDEIPARLYLAVAQVLAYIFQLKRAGKSGDATPAPPSNLDVPDELWKGKH
jgi:flagellar biosynthetic protein FlhB